MSKNIFVYPCNSYVGRAVAKAFGAAGHSVTGLAVGSSDVPECVETYYEVGDSGAASAHKQLLLTADVVVYDLLGNEQATRDAVVQLAQQPYGGREVLFVAVSSPLVWAATRPNPVASLGEWGAPDAAAAAAADTVDGLDDSAAAPAATDAGGGAAAGGGAGGEEDASWLARGTVPGRSGGGAGGGGGSGTGSADGGGSSLLGLQGERPNSSATGGSEGGRLLSPPYVAPTFSAPEDVTRRTPAVAARAALAVEQVVLRAGRRGRLRTAVVCPGLLYGEGEDDLTFFGAFKTAWTLQCRPAPGPAALSAASAAALPAAAPAPGTPGLTPGTPGASATPPPATPPPAVPTTPLSQAPPTPPAPSPVPGSTPSASQQRDPSAAAQQTPTSSAVATPGAAAAGAGAVSTPGQPAPATPLAATGPRPASSSSSNPSRPKIFVYGRGTNILPTLHVADLAAYVIALSGLAPSAATGAGGGAGAGAGSSSTAPASAATTRPVTPAVAAAAATAAAAPAVPPPAPQPSSSAPSTAGGAAAAAALAAAAAAATAAAAAAAAAAPPPPPVVLLPPSGGYFLVTDGSRVSQLELANTIAAALGLGPGEDVIEFVPETELHRHPAPLRTRMLLDLSLATTPLPPPLPSFTLSRPGGLTMQAAAVATEFTTARRLTPLRLLVTGPPLSGKTHLARRLAQQYGLVYLNTPLLLAAAADPALAAAVGLSPVTDTALIRTAMTEVATPVTGTGGAAGGRAERERERERDRDGGNTGWAGNGRVSAKTLGALLAAAMADPRAAARCRGFVLDGFPRSAAQAKAAFYVLERDEAAIAAAEAAAAAAAQQVHPKTRGGASRGQQAAPATPSNPCGVADTFEVPVGMRLVPNPLTAPTHVLELDVGEEQLRARMAAIAAAADEVASRLTGEPSTLSEPSGTFEKKPAAAGPKRGPGGKAPVSNAKDLAVAAALGHNNEAGFTRRMTAFQTWRNEDAADLRARTAAAQAAWDAEQARLAAEAARAAAEASTLKAKRRRAREEAAAAAAAAAAAGTAVGEGGGTAAGTATVIATGDEGAVQEGTVSELNGGAAAEAVEVPKPPLPQYGGLVALCLDTGASHVKIPNPTVEDGPLITVNVQPPPSAFQPAAPATTAGASAAAAAAAAATPAVPPPGSVAAAVREAATTAPPAPPPLPSLEWQVEVFLGGPHNFDGFPPPVQRLSQTGAALEAAAEAARAEAQAQRDSEAAAAAELAAAQAVTDGAEASYNYRLRSGRGEAVRRYLLQRVMPVITAALADASLERAMSEGVPERTGGGDGLGSVGSGKEVLLRVARALQAAAEEEEVSGFLDPYLDPSYGIQLAKIEAKAAREAARAAAAAAKAEREAAARHQPAEEPAA
ncbi:hypothetical protein Agub_g13552 [Astrephomene gubernaculifera]|uniref:adenylate kinase n=1 Tax=Astrephomene gubernaculifera TaxID=47775 RepID=A0AAD3E219_9CHLO|nr:hypothetical protein Agub_g13552 [Astrephomene gubernaculifera]